MLAHTHFVIALAVGSYAFDNIHNTLIGGIFFYYLVLLVAAVLPDIDQTGSMINKAFTFTAIIPWFFKHRGFFHSIWPLLIGSIGLYFVHPLVSTAFFIGYGSHLVSDSFTKAGVNWLYPCKFKIQGPLKTGSIGEGIIFFACIVALISYFFA